MTREEQEKQKLDERIGKISGKYENSPEAVAILDRRMELRWANAAFSALFPHGETLRAELCRLGYPADRQKMEKLMKTRRVELTLTLGRDEKDRRRKKKRTACITLLDMGEGDFCGMQLAIRSPLAQPSVAPEELQYGAGFQSYMRGGFSQIYSYLKKIARTEGVSQPVQELLQLIYGETLNLERSTQDFCRMTDAKNRIRTGGQTAVHLTGELEELCQRLEETGRKTGTPFTYELPEERLISCNMALLKEAVEELAANAFRYARGSRVHLEAAYRDGRIWVTVTDDGIGRMKEEADRAMLPFFSYDPQMSGSQAGGMGLSSIRARIRLEEGDMGVEFSAGNGTKGWFFLPCPSGEEWLKEGEADMGTFTDAGDGWRGYMLRMLPVEGPPELVRQER